MKHVVGEKCSVVQQENYYLFLLRQMAAHIKYTNQYTKKTHNTQYKKKLQTCTTVQLLQRKTLNVTELYSCQQPEPKPQWLQDLGSHYSSMYMSQQSAALKKLRNDWSKSEKYNFLLLCLPGSAESFVR